MIVFVKHTKHSITKFNLRIVDDDLIISKYISAIKLNENLLYNGLITAYSVPAKTCILSNLDCNIFATDFFFVQTQIPDVHAIIIKAFCSNLSSFPLLCYML